MPAITKIFSQQAKGDFPGGGGVSSFSRTDPGARRRGGARGPVRSGKTPGRAADALVSRVRSASGGFTLFEVLIAAVMLSFVFTTLFVSYRQILSGAEVVSRKTAQTEMTSAALHHLVADLEAGYVLQPPFYKPPDLREDTQDRYRWTGKTTPTGGTSFADIRFASRRHIDLKGDGAEGIAAIRYFVEEDDADGYRLKRDDRLVAFDGMDPSDEEIVPVVCEHIERFEVSYIDADGDDHDGWDSESESFGYATPTAVRIVIGTLGPRGEAVALKTTVYLTSRRLEKGTDDR